MHTSPMRIPSLSSMYPSSQSSAICPGIPSSPSTQVRNFLDVMADEPNWLEASDGENASPNAKHRKASSRRYSFRENDIVNGRQHGAAVGERIGHSPSFRTPLDRASSVTLPDSEDEEEIYPPARRPLSTLSTELERIRGRQAVNETQVSATQTDGGDEEHTRLTQTFAMVAPRTRHDLPTNLENETQGSVTQSSSNGDGDTTILPHARGAQAENASTVPTLVSGSSRSSIDRVDQAIYDTQNARGAESSGIEIPQPAPDNTQSSVTQPDSDSEYQELHPTVDQEDLSESYGSSSEECLPAAVKGFLEMFEEGSMPSYFRESYEG
ncbi:hypothetical protein BD410DRAFT_2076 [Rickenella mellea]|uniref:Uncharacterized protein n=1 Tax=Rickenella mellea TaxID=50990 RepID=A0A4R5XDD6_9AGAM|nr:hypothetical protein BD410DRAFT_2076 [Rickenella mellea]